MAKVILTSAPGSHYDDLPEERYHLPSIYFNQIEKAVGDWAVFYEPRRAPGENQQSGRQSYFAIALIDRVDPDPVVGGHYYAYTSQYLEFDTPVSFRRDEGTYEARLVKQDGSLNKGQFGRAVRLIEDHEFENIVSAGFSGAIQPWEKASEPLPVDGVERPWIERVVGRPFRDRRFRLQVREAYENTCAVSGLKLINGGGRPEVEAAHIRPVADAGPDSIRNGLALTRTVHWLFDRGLIAIGNDYRLLVSNHGLPDGLGMIVRPGAQLKLPLNPTHHPDERFLGWHRNHVFHHAARTQ